MRNLLQLLERVADEKSVAYLCKLVEKNGFNRDIVYFPHLIDSKDINKLENILTECLMDLPF
jgi:hypothetical protein